MTRDQLVTMLSMQQAINAQIHPEWERQAFPWYRAIWIECGELLDHYGWKWWKQQITVKLGGSEVKCAPAMAFVLKSTELLSSKGKILAILPEGSLFSHRDTGAWEYLRDRFNITNMASNQRGIFKEVTAQTNIVLMKRISAEDAFVAMNAPYDRLHCDLAPLSVQRMIRGNIPIYRAAEFYSKRGIPLIHTTNLQQHKVDGSFLPSVSVTNAVGGPLVLMSRVGKPSLSKVTLYLSHSLIALSDCVIALKCSSSTVARLVFQRLHSHWPEIERRYGGTGAPSISMETLRCVLEEMNIHETTQA